MQQEKYDLSIFKRDINLASFAAARGYEMDRKKSTKTSIAMKSSNDKIIITKKGGIWVYFSVFDEQDSGTIVDFVANRSVKSIPEIGNMLAQWSGLGATAISAHHVEEPVYDQNRVKKILHRASQSSSTHTLRGGGFAPNCLPLLVLQVECLSIVIIMLLFRIIEITRSAAWN